MYEHSCKKTGAEGCGFVTDGPADRWDAGHMGCGELVLQLRARLSRLRPGELLELTALDLGAPEDLPSWCRMTGHELIAAEHPLYLIKRRTET